MPAPQQRQPNYQINHQNSTDQDQEDNSFTSGDPLGLGSLTDDQMLRLEQLARSDILFDDLGNIIESNEEIILN